MLDGNILLWIQEYIRNPVLTNIFKTVTVLGNAGFIWILLVMILLFYPKTRTVGWMGAAALAGTLLINNVILKNLAGRIRPYEVVQGLIPLIPYPADSSFPSGHTGCAFAVGWLMFRKLPKRFGVPILVLAILISLSRLYVGVHYPTDVLGGMITGIAISYLAEYVVNGFRGNS